MDLLRNIFLFNEDSPLIFTRSYFWGFFAVVLLFYSILYKKNALRNAYLFLVSLFFYYKTGGLFFFILIFSTLTDYGIGHAIYNSKSSLAKKLWVALSVFLNLGVLAFFKYDYFFTETINSVFHTNLEVVTHAAKWSNAFFGTHFDLGKILPPVGISFFTFQTISYSVDVYRGLVKPVKSIADFGFYVSFFPQLVAGPIVRAADFIPQLYRKFTLTHYEYGLAIYLVLKGLVKKMFVGDYIAVNLIDRVFANPASYSGFENLIALYGYSVQVYCDFSGYTDIAIGIALLMGFYLPKNFNSPYKATSTGSFWKRWHISLSSWLKDYLYIPMGGNRGGSSFTFISLTFILLFLVLIAGNLWLVPIFSMAILFVWLLAKLFPGIRNAITTNINIMMTMLIGGLWHGSSWMFVLWGGLNGVGIVVYKFWKSNSQIARWIIFIALNIAAFVTYQFKIWANPAGFTIWVLLDFAWFISYFIWKIKWNAEKREPVWYLNLIISLVFITVFSIIITNISGLNNSYNKTILTGIFIILGASAYYIFSIDNIIKWGIIPLIINFLAVVIVLLAGNHSEHIILWLIISVICFLVYFLHMIRNTIERPFLVHFWGIFLTFNFITFTRIWFRGESMKGTFELLTQVSTNFDLPLVPQMIANYWKPLVIMIFGLFVHWIPETTKIKYRDWFINTPVYQKILICVTVVFILYQSLSAELTPFIYFQF